MSKMELKGKTALITGAASGIGAALARRLAKAGCHLALADINQDGLGQISAEVQKLAPQVRVTRHVIDMSDLEQVPGLVIETVAAHGELSLLFNNAGVAIGGDFDEVPVGDFDWLMRINLLGPIALAREALKAIRETPEGTIVNTSSLFGLIAPAGQTAYCTSKFGFRGFSEALRHELQGSSVNLMVVHPGGIRTNIAENAKIPANIDSERVDRDMDRLKKALKMDPDKAAGIIIHGLVRRRKRVLVGADAKLLDLVQRITPTGYNFFVERVF